MPIRSDIKAEAQAEIDAEALKKRDEVGISCTVDWHYDGEAGAFAGYTVTTRTDNGLEKVFNRVNAAAEPDPQDIAQKYCAEVVEEIKRVRKEAVRIRR